MLNSIILLVSILIGVLLILLVARRWERLATQEQRVVLTGGGTGGHVNPALAIAECIKQREPETQFLYVGVKGKAETIIVRRVGYPLKFVLSEGFPGLRISIRTVRFLCKLSLGVIQSLFILCRFAPRRVIATGGYVSAPMILAALILRSIRVGHTKIFLHEQNSIPGQLNAFLGRWVDRVLLTFPQTITFFPRNGVVVGYPIRHSVALKPREEALANQRISIPEGRQVVFAFGGSQGSRTINRAIVDALHDLLPYRDRLFIIHGTGLAKNSDYDAAADTELRLLSRLTVEERDLLDEFYYRQDYFHDIADIYSLSDLIVCRSGAGSLNEISNLGKPALLIPKVNLPGDHQVMNARVMKHSGAAEVLIEDTVIEDGEVIEMIEGRVLAERIMRLLEDREHLMEMGENSRQFLWRNANERILSELFQDRSYQDGLECRSVSFRPLVSNQRLLQILSAAYAGSPAAYNPVAVVGDEDDLIYYRHRAAGLLSHKAWQDVNIGVKLIGFTHHREKIPTLVHMLTDRTPAPLIRRMFGGDFKHVGFVRRNIVHAFQVMNCFDSEVDRALLAAAEDPYFEVRSAACRAAAHFGTRLAGNERWLEVLLKRLDDECFEVAVDAAKALGEVGTDERAVEVLLRMRESHYWQARDAALKGLNRLMERAVIHATPEFLSQISRFILTATDFRPHFSIKETYRTIDSCCRQRLTAGCSHDPTPDLPDTATRKT